MPLCDEFVTYCQNFDFKIRRDHQKNSFDGPTMSRWTKTANLRLSAEKRQNKKNSGSKGLR